ncbi:Arginine kinase [Pseudolycoriella hygida]|uniref:arginine kinase n=1 Tax=Pseudolycoriella hygida TaxID=35572 RepID=A0A9Q0RWH5_9DIPT|nr:Arginine kinase [Pseudolycoriella hygida]
MSTIDEKRAAFHQYLASSGVISALSKALIKLYEEPVKPDDPVNFVRRHMGSENFFILGEGKVQNAEEEELVLSSLIEKKNDEKETAVGNVEVESVPTGNGEIVNEEGDKQAEEANGLEEGTERTEATADKLNAEFEKLKLNEKCNSILKTHLDDEILEKLKGVNDDDGAALFDCIKSGLENQDSQLGIYATNLKLYDQFSEIFDPIIETYHGFGKETMQPNSDWGDSQAFTPFPENDEIVVAIRINCMRNLEEYPVVCKMEENDLNESLAKIKAITEGFEDTFKGTFYTTAELSEDQETELKSIGGLMEKSDKNLSSANVYQQWPTGRGIFVTDDKSLIIHVNGEDHLKFISIGCGKDFGKIYQRLVDAVNIFEVSFVRHERLGWLTFCPSNLGTALNISVDLKLPKLHSHPDKLQEIIKSSSIQLKLSDNEVEDTYTLNNQCTMGHSEFDLAKQFYDVVQTIIESESSVE